MKTLKISIEVVGTPAVQADGSSLKNVKNLSLVKHAIEDLARRQIVGTNFSQSQLAVNVEWQGDLSEPNE